MPSYLSVSRKMSFWFCPGHWRSGKLAAPEQKLLTEHVSTMVKDEKYKKPPALAAPVLKDREEASYRSQFRIELDAAADVKMEKKREQLAVMMADGTFKAYLNSTRAPRAVQTTERRAPASSRELTAKEAATLQDAAFEECGVTWHVLKAQWDDSFEEIIVFYYDALCASSAGVLEEDLDEDHEFVEHSSVGELMEWIKAGRVVE